VPFREEAFRDEVEVVVGCTYACAQDGEDEEDRVEVVDHEGNVQVVDDEDRKEVDLLDDPVAFRDVEVVRDEEGHDAVHQVDLEEDHQDVQDAYHEEVHHLLHVQEGDQEDRQDAVHQDELNACEVVVEYEEDDDVLSSVSRQD